MESESLSANEYEVLCSIIAANDPTCARRLLDQLDAATVDRPLVQDLTFRLDRDSLLPAPCGNGPLPVQAIVWAADDDPVGIITVWIQDGFLQAAEYSWFTEEPSAYPRLEQVELWVPDSDGSYPERIRRGESAS